MMQDRVDRWRAALLAVILFLGVPRQGGGAEPAPLAKPEKNRLEVGTAGSGTTSLPLFVALEGGYFTKRGLSVSVNQLGATVAVQGIISGTVDIYQGGTAAIAANLAGADIIYVAAAVDRNSLILFGQKSITSFENLRGKSIATTFPGAFGEIAVRMTARKVGMEVGKDVKLLYHRSPPEALSTFLTGNADALVISPPQTELAKQQGYPVIIDYFKEGLKIVGPGTAVTRDFAQKYANTIKAYLMGYLDGLRRAIDDEEFAKKIESKYTKIHDAKILHENYQQGLRVWNRDMTVDPAAIRVVLDDSADLKAKSADPKRFYDNSLIQAVNREYASKLFPGEVK
jgi:ABC-type nitrate/sulfonate/bicarbonate transport system substrate-binding protein